MVSPLTVFICTYKRSKRQYRLGQAQSTSLQFVKRWWKFVWVYEGRPTRCVRCAE